MSDEAARQAFIYLREKAQEFMHVTDELAEITKRAAALRKLKGSLTQQLVEVMSQQEVDEADGGPSGKIRLQTTTRKLPVKGIDYLNCLKDLNASMAQTVQETLESKRQVVKTSTIRRLRDRAVADSMEA